MGVALQLNDYRLTTAEILYRLPDHPGILQRYIWQELDLAPCFPVLHKSLSSGAANWRARCVRYALRAPA